MAGPGETLGRPWPPHAIRPCRHVVSSRGLVMRMSFVPVCRLYLDYLPNHRATRSRPSDGHSVITRESECRPVIDGNRQNNRQPRTAWGIQGGSKMAASCKPDLKRLNGHFRGGYLQTIELQGMADPIDILGSQ
jgi:hypothetical protein